MTKTIHKARLKDTLVARSMEPAALAALAGLCRTTVCRILRVRTADARIRYNTLLQLAAVLCVSTAFLQNTTVISTPDPVTLIFRLCYLDKERKALAKFFPGHPGLQKHDRIFSSLHTEYLQTKKCLLP